MNPVLIDLPDPEPPRATRIEPHFTRRDFLVMWDCPNEQRRRTEIFGFEEEAREVLRWVEFTYGEAANACMVWQEWTTRVTPLNAWDRILYHQTFDTDDTVTT